MKPSILLGMAMGFAVSSVAQTASCSFQRDEVLKGTDGVILRQYVNEQAGTVTVQLDYPGLGWVGFAFSSTMVGSTAVIGLPGDESTNVSFYTLGGYDVNVITPRDDLQAKLSNASIEQTEQETILTFTMPTELDGKSVVQAGKSTSIIYGVGSSNTLGIHKSRQVTQVVFDACGSQVSPSDSAPETTPATAPTSAPATTPATAPATTPATAPATTPATAPTTSTVLPDGVVAVGKGVTLKSSPNVGAGTVDFKLVYEGKAWLAVGFSRDGSMVGSEAVIGLPDDTVSGSNPGKYNMASKSVSGVTLMSADKQTLTNAKIEQNDTHTVLSFTKIASESGEIEIKPTGSNTFLYAVGVDNTLGFHAQRNSFNLVPGGSDANVSGKSLRRDLWVAHGVFMAVAWGIFVPLAIGSSMLRNILPLPPGMWFQFHYMLNSAAITFTIIGLAIAVVAINDQTPDGGDAQHFRGPPKHKSIGFVIFLLALIQGGVALFRPHPPSAAPSAKASNEDEEHGQDKAEENHAPEEKTTIRLLWEIKHRIFGMVLLSLAWYNVDSGLRLFATLFAEKSITAIFWGVTGGLSSIIFIVYVISTVLRFVYST